MNDTKKVKGPLNGKYILSCGFGGLKDLNLCDEYLDRFLCRLWQKLIKVSRGKYWVIDGQTYLELLMDVEAIDEVILRQLWVFVMSKGISVGDLGVYPATDDDADVFGTLEDVSFFSGHSVGMLA